MPCLKGKVPGEPMNLPTERYVEQMPRWPSRGRHILAHFDESSIIVYQAYNPAIGRFALAHGHLGGPDFSLSRMSWIKPNFLWMMYRSGWGTKEGQHVTLGLRLSRDFFDGLLELVVPSTHDPHSFPDRAAWQAAIETSEVRLQWDPDHAPAGQKMERRAIQIGLRGSMLQALAKGELIEIIDLTEFVAAQRPHALGSDPSMLEMPVERVYTPRSVAARKRIQIDVL